jgi:hypothetical protein
MKNSFNFLYVVSHIILVSCNQSTQKKSSVTAADAIYYGGDILTL